MALTKDEQDKLKQEAAAKAVEYVENGMVLGLGTGTTVNYALEKLADRIFSEKLEVVGIPTSIETDRLAQKLKIPLTDLEKNPKVDLTIDGADEVAPDFNLIKGLGGALVREKIVASNTKKEIIIVDKSKMVEKLGTRSPLPVEVIQFGWNSCAEALKEFDCEITLRKKNNNIMISDNSNYILDCKFRSIDDPKGIESKINNIPGVIENGLFIGLANIIIVASENGVEVLTR